MDSIDAWVWWLIGAAGLGIALVVTAMPELGMLALGAVAGAVVAGLGGGVVLQVVVFAIVNVTVLYLRRDPVEHEHFRIPSGFPVLGVAVSIALMTQIEPQVWARAGILLAVGLGLWLLNLVIVGRRRPATA